MQGSGRAALVERAVVTHHGRTASAPTLLALATVAVALLTGCPKDPAGGPYPGIQLSVTSLVTEENGANVEVEVSLATPPASTVVVSLTSQDLTEGKLIPPGGTLFANPVVLQFGTADWNVPRVVQVDPQPDYSHDGNQGYKITASVTSTTDTAYLAVPARDISVTNVDADVPGFTLSKATASTSEAATTDSFTVRLNWPPSGTVTVPVTAGDASEGLVQGGSASTPAASLLLTFTTANWSSPQTVTIAGQDDDVADGNRTWSVAVGPPTGAAEYAALAEKTVAVTNVDDDIPGITVAAPAVPLVTSEGGATSTFSVRLNTEPVGTVTVPVTTGSAAEGLLSAGAQNGLALVSLTFTAADWSDPQIVTVKGQDDAAAPVSGDNVEYYVTVGKPSGDPAYAALAAQAVQVLNVDDEVAAVIVPALAGAPLQTRETGTGKNATFTVMLNEPPAAPVTVRVTAGDVTEGKVMGGSSPTVAAESIDLTFTAEDYLTPQLVTVVGQADTLADGEQAYTITIGTPTGDAAYAGVAPQQLQVANADTNVAGFTVSAASVTHAEGGAVATFTVRLNAEPLADVIVPVRSGNPAEGLIAGGSSGGAFVEALDLVFTSGDWATPQTIQVQGQVDSIDDGPKGYVITVGPTGSTSALFDRIAAKEVAATNEDVDTAGIALEPASVATSEAGLSGSFTVRLTSKPLGAVTLRVSSSDLTEALVGGSAPGAGSMDLLFDATSWSVPQPVTVYGVQDTTVDGTRPFSVRVAPLAGATADPAYSGFVARTVTGSNGDDDVGVSEGTSTPVVLTIPSNQYLGEVGPADSSYYSATLPPGATFAVRLSYPLAEVTVTADDDGDFAAGTFCTATVAADGARYCSGVVPAGGTVFIRVSTASAVGAGYQLRVLLYQTFVATDVPHAIPDSGYWASFYPLTVTGAPDVIKKVRLRVTITHARMADVGFLLRPPVGSSKTVQVAVGHGGDGDGYVDTVFDDDAPTQLFGGTPPYTGTFRPDYPLSEVDGTSANGTWYIGVQDLYLVNTGSLISWSIDLL